MIPRAKINCDAAAVHVVDDPVINNIATASMIEDISTLTKGYAWLALREHVTEVVGPRARVILEHAFQRGVAKGGDRQSCFQMVSTTTSHLTTTRAHTHRERYTHTPHSLAP